MALSRSWIEELAKSDLSLAEKRLRLAHAVASDPDIKALPPEERRKTLDWALRKIGAEPGPVPFEHVEEERPAWLKPLDALASLSSAIGHGIYTAGEAVGNVPITMGRGAYRAAEGAAAKVDADVMGLLNLLSGYQLSRVEPYRKLQERFETQAKESGTVANLIGSGLEDAALLALAPESAIAKVPGGASAAQKILMRLARGAKLGGVLTAAHEVPEFGKATEEPPTPGEVAAHVGLGTVGGGVLDVGLGGAGDLLGRAAAKVLRPAEGSVSWYQAGALVRAGVDKMSRRQVLEAMMALDLPSPVEGETEAQVRERLIAFLTAKERGLKPRPEDFGPGSAPKVAEAAGGGVTSAEALEALTGASTAQERVSAAAAAGEGTAVPPSEVAAGVAGPRLSGEKPPDFPVNLRVLSQGDEEKKQSIRELVLKVADELERIRTNPTEADAELVYSSSPEGAALRNIALHEPEKVHTYSEALNARIGKLETQRREILSKIKDLPPEAPERQASELLLQDIERQRVDALKERAMAGLFFGKALKGLDTGGIRLTASPWEIADAALKEQFKNRPEVLARWERISETIDPHDPAAVKAAATAAKRGDLKTAEGRRVLAKHLGDYYNMFWFENILSGLGTHTRNIVTNITVPVLFETPEHAVAGILSRATGKGTLSQLDAVAHASGTWDGILRGGVAMSKILSGEIQPEKMALISGRQKFLETARPTTLEGVMDIYTTPGLKLLAAEDVAFKGLAFGQSLRRQAAQILRSRGITRWQEIKEAMPKIMEEISEGKHPEVLERAIEEAKHVTFTDEPGKIANAIKGVLNVVPGSRHIVPFVDVPSRLLSYAVDRIPVVGGIRGLSALRKAAMAGGDEAQALYNKAMREFAKSIMGSFYLAMAAALYANGRMEGSLETYGLDSEEARKRKAKRMQGIPPRAIKVGNTWVQYNGLGPIAYLLDLGAGVVDVSTKLKGEEYDKALGALWETARDLVGDQSYFQALPILSRLVEGKPGRLAKALVAQHVPQAGLMQGITRATDTGLRETRSSHTFTTGLPKQAQGMIPGVSQKLPPRFDNWGRPIEYRSPGVARIIGPQFISKEHPDELITKLAEANYMPQEIKPSYTARIAGKTLQVDLTPEEMAVLAKHRRQALEDLKTILAREKKPLSRPELYILARRVVGAHNRKAYSEMEKLGGSSRAKAKALLAAEIEDELAAAGRGIQ